MKWRTHMEKTMTKQLANSIDQNSFPRSRYGSVIAEHDCENTLGA